MIPRIHARAPPARVPVVGYADGLPQNGSNCYRKLPFSGPDLGSGAWVNDLRPSPAAFPLHPKWAVVAHLAEPVKGAL